MKKILFFTMLFVFTGLLACREQASQHKDGDTKHEGHGTAADTTHNH